MPPGERQGLLHHLPRRGEVAPAMLVDLGDLLPRSRVELAGRRGPPPPRARAPRPSAPGASRGGRAAAAAARARASAGRCRAPGGSRPDSASGSAASQHPAEAGQRLRIELGMRRARHRVRDPAGERGQREDVVPVVLEHPRQLVRPLAPQVLEVHGGDQRARQVVVSQEAEHVLLDRPEPAVGQARAPEPPRRAEQVEVEGVARASGGGRARSASRAAAGRSRRRCR